MRFHFRALLILTIPPPPWSLFQMSLGQPLLGQTCLKMWWGFAWWLLELPSFEQELGPVTTFLWPGLPEKGTVGKQFAHK